jgi:hypothetical protein
MPTNEDRGGCIQLIKYHQADAHRAAVWVHEEVARFTATVGQPWDCVRSTSSRSRPGERSSTSSAENGRPDRNRARNYSTATTVENLMFTTFCGAALLGLLGYEVINRY